MKKTFLTVLRSNDMRYFVISDIHNCCTALKAALKEKGFDITDPKHAVIFLGDAFEKGDEPQETYIYLKELLDCGKLIWIRGNHDIELINAIKSKKLNKTNRSTATALAQVLNPAITDGTPDETICETLLQTSKIRAIITKRKITCSYTDLSLWIRADMSTTGAIFPPLDGRVREKSAPSAKL